MIHRASWCQVRRESSQRLHALAGRLSRQRQDEGLTDGQERLWDQIIGELEWRSYRSRRVYQRCSCWLCVPPPEEDY